MPFSYKIIKHISTLSENQYESKQVNIISYNNDSPKIDIRKWSNNNGNMSKGIALNYEEWQELGKCFNSRLNAASVLEDILWLSKTNSCDYEIIPEGFGIDINFESKFSLDSENSVITFFITFQTEEKDVQKNIDFINSANKYFFDNRMNSNAFGENESINIAGNIPLQCDLTENALNSLENFLSDYSDKINEIGCISSKQLYINDVIVIGDQTACVHDTHRTEEICVAVDFVKEDGNILRVEAKAFYCSKCNLFFMRKHDYRIMKVKAGNAKMCCQEIEQEKYYKGHNFNNNLNDHSILNVYGYNVSANENLTVYQRQTILANIVDRGILTKNRIASYLSYFIRLNESKTKNFEDSIEKWNVDRDFILDYNVDFRRMVEPRKITVIHYKATAKKK